MLSTKFHIASDELNSHISGALHSASFPSMYDSRDRREVGLPAYGAQSVTKIGLLKIQEERVIKASHLFERLTSNHQRSPLDPRNYPSVIVRPGTQQACPENGDTATEPTQIIIVEHPAERSRERKA